MKLDSMGQERVNAKLAPLVPSAALTRSWPMLLVNQTDGGWMATMDLKQRDIG
jgi:hypothetical protein